jgi:hypothetical protein
MPRNHAGLKGRFATSVGEVASAESEGACHVVGRRDCTGLGARRRKRN